MPLGRRAASGALALLAALAPSSALADCYVTWNCGSAACAQVYGSASGRRGPFASCADFQQVDNVGHCSCDSGASGGSAAAPAPALGGGGLTPEQQMGMQIGVLGAQMLGQGLHQALFGDPEQAAREQAARAAQEAEQRRVEEEKQRRFEAEKGRVLDQMGGGSSAMSFKDDAAPEARDASAPALEAKPAPKPMDPRFKSPAFSSGFDAASRCASRSGGAACGAVPGDQLDACMDDYRAGYDFGAKQEAARLELAAKKGETAGASGKRDDAASDPDSGGDCRIQWVEAYNRGYFQGAHAARPAAPR